MPYNLPPLFTPFLHLALQIADRDIKIKYMYNLLNYAPLNIFQGKNDTVAAT